MCPCTFAQASRPPRARSATLARHSVAQTFFPKVESRSTSRPETKSMDKIIAAMKIHGWYEADNRIKHAVFGKYDSWEESVVACIGVACE